MAQVEPMDIDDIDSEFDNKENSSHQSNVLPRTPCMEKGYEELDVSELNMKLRYSITPAASPMSKSLNDSESNTTTAMAFENSNLTRSLNSSITKSETPKSIKSLPLQIHLSDKVIDDRNPSVLHTIQADNNNVTVTLGGENDDNISLPSTSSSVTHTPEATTPTKDIPKHDGSSPIMRGLKSVLNMFRSSQSPIPPSESTFNNMKQENLSPNISILKDMDNNRCETVVVSTPISNNRKVSNESRRSSPLKESIVFNDDLEKDLLWKDETTIFFKDEKIPIHKLFPTQSMCNSKTLNNVTKTLKMDKHENKNITEEYMSMSNNASISLSGNTMNMQVPSLQNDVSALESDGEFVDCEMTLNGESYNSVLTEKGDDAFDITRNDNICIYENTKQVIDNIEDLLTDCEGNKSYVVHQSYEASVDVCTAIIPDHTFLLNCNTSDRKEFESKTNIISESHSERGLENNGNTIRILVSNIEGVQSERNDLSAEEHTTPTDVTLCEDNVNKCDLSNDNSEKPHPSEVPLPDDNNVDFMEFANTTHDMNEPVHDLNQTAMSVDHSDSVLTQANYCKHVQHGYEIKLDQDNNQETTDHTSFLKQSDVDDVSVTAETTLQPVGLHKQGDCIKSQVIDPIDTPVNVSIIPVTTQISEDKNTITNEQNELMKNDDPCVSGKETKIEKLTLEEFNNEHLKISMCENDVIPMDSNHSTTDHASLNNCGMLKTPKEQNTVEAQNSFDISAIKEHHVTATATTISMTCDLKESDKYSVSFLNNDNNIKTMDKGDEPVVIESNIKDLIPDKLTNFDNTYLNETNDCAMDTTFDMDAKKENFGNIISMVDVKKLVQSDILENAAIKDLDEISKNYEDEQKNKNTKIYTLLNSVADMENKNINDTLEPEVFNHGDCLSNKEINIYDSENIVLPEENKTVNVSDILNPVNNEGLQSENCLNVRNCITTDNPSNLPDQDTLIETIEVFACQTEKSDSKCDVLQRFAENSSSHEKENDSIMTKINILSVKSSEPKNVFNLPEMSSAFISKQKENIPASTPDAEDGSRHIFKVPSSNLLYSQKCDSNPQEIDRKLCIDKTELDSSDVSTSSKASEATVHEVNTEDDDTVEASFFETEEFNDVDKKSDHEDMIDFSDIPTQRINNNAYKGEMFIDAEAFQFLLNQNKSNVVADSGRESLFLKFDPLFAKRMSTDAAAVSKIQKGQSTPKRISKALSNIDFYRNANETAESTLEANFEDATVLLSKPMMVVNPAVNSVFSPRNKSCTPPRSNRRSHTFTSPAIAVIDRLLSLSGDNSALNLEISMSDVRGRSNETDQVLTQLRELLAEKEINVHGLRSESKELSERLRTLESQVKILETESEHRLRKVDDLNKCLVEKTKMNKGMAVVVEEYERTIASLTAEIEQDKKMHAEERMKLINERNEQNAHLASMTMSFNDLHSKYEKNKQIILNCKDNEEKYKRSIKEFDESVIKIQNNYELLKQHATSNLNNKNDEFEKLNRTHEADVLKYGAMIKRKEMDISSLKETLAQKIKANEELTAICDELLNKVA